MATTQVTADQTGAAETKTDQQTAQKQTTAQQAERESIQKKYEEYYGAPPAQTTETVVSTDTSTSTEAPKPSIEEVLTAAINQALTPVVERLAALEKPAVTAVSTATTEPAKKKLVDYLREGDVDGFEAALVERVRETVSPQTIQESTDQAVARVHAENEIQRFVEDIQAKNTDLQPMQSWIVAEAANLLRAVPQDKIKTLDDYMTVYKKSVTDAVDTVRKAVQTIRGSGKSEAMTVRQEVIKSGVISPSATERQTGTEKQPDKEPETNVDYISRRQQSHFTGRGL